MCSLSCRNRKAKLEEEAGQYAELKQKLSGIMVREDDGPLEMLSDLGADCFTKVQVHRDMPSFRGPPPIW